MKQESLTAEPSLKRLAQHTFANSFLPVFFYSVCIRTQMNNLTLSEYKTDFHTLVIFSAVAFAGVQEPSVWKHFTEHFKCILHLGLKVPLSLWQLPYGDTETSIFVPFIL